MPKPKTQLCYVSPYSQPAHARAYSRARALYGYAPSCDPADGTPWRRALWTAEAGLAIPPAPPGRIHVMAYGDPQPGMCKPSGRSVSGFLAGLGIIAASTAGVVWGLIYLGWSC